MEDYKQPDTPETCTEVEMLLDQQSADGETQDSGNQEEASDLQEEGLQPKDQQPEDLQPQDQQPEDLQPQDQQPEDLQPEDLQPEDLQSAGTALTVPTEMDMDPKQLSEAEKQPSETEEQLPQTEEQPKADQEQPSESETESEQPTEEAPSQAVTLDTIQDPESVIFVNKAKSLLNELDEAQKDKGRLSSELKQSEKAYSSMEKSVAEGITVALKKKKEEIAATYDHELSEYQDQIDACKTERAKAKANAIAQRIQVETAPLNQQNQELEAQIELKFKENKVPLVCKKHTISMLFFPKNGRDWTADILIGIGLMLFVPLFFALAISNRFVLAFTFFLYIGVLFASYLYLLHKFMLRYAGVNAEVEELRRQIRVNNKNKQLMTNRIKKSQDETGYNLGSFDDKIAGIQQTMQDTVAKREEALENFESEIRHQITADITAANKEELLNLQQQFEDKRQELAANKEQIEQLEEQLKNEYEPVFGKDLLYKQRLGSFDTFCQENADLSLEEALTQYRALSGGKLLKK